MIRITDYELEYDYDAEVDDVLVDPHEALKALQEQAPEVLRNYTPEYEISATCFGDNTAELTWCDLETGETVALTVSITPEEAKKLSKVVPACVYSEARLKSPWRKMEDEEPPKDGHWLMEFTSGSVSSCKHRYGILGEPAQDTLAWRCDCCGRFANPKR